MNRLIRRTAAENFVYVWQSIWCFNVQVIRGLYSNNEEDNYDARYDELDENIEVDINDAGEKIASSFADSKADLEEIMNEDLGIAGTLELNVDENTLTIRLTTAEELPDDKQAAFADWWEGQLSDGWGEGLDGESIYEGEREEEANVADYADYEEWARNNDAPLDDEEEGFDEAYEQYQEETFDILVQTWCSICVWPEHFKLTKL